jgi:hypothetical protein
VKRGAEKPEPIVQAPFLPAYEKEKEEKNKMFVSFSSSTVSLRTNSIKPRGKE